MESRPTPTKRHRPGSVTFQDNPTAHSHGNLGSIQEDEHESPPPRPPPPVTFSTWDVFLTEDVQKINSCDTSGFWTTLAKIAKVITVLLLFILTLAGAVVSKGTLLYAAANIRDSSQLPLICTNTTAMDILDPSTHYEIKCLAYQHNITDIEDADSLSCLRHDDTELDVEQRQMCDLVAGQWMWCMSLIIMTPYIFTFLKCLWRIVFKKCNTPDVTVILVVCLMDTLYCAGVCTLGFVVLPLLNTSIQAAIIMLGVGIVSSIMLLSNRLAGDYNPVHVILDFGAVIFQGTAIFAWPIMHGLSDTDNVGGLTLCWSIPVGLILVSTGWWQNYTTDKGKLPFNNFLWDIKERSIECKSKLHFCASVWKAIVVFLFTIGYAALHQDIRHLDTDVSKLFNLDFEDECSGDISPLDIPAMGDDWIWVWLINMGAGLVAYFCARTAAKIQAQQFGYALPVTISTFVVWLGLRLGCDARASDPCIYHPDLPIYSSFQCPEKGTSIGDMMTDYWVVWAIFWFISQLWITWHIWHPSNEKLAHSETLFVVPLYDGLLLEQSLLYNRNRADKSEVAHTVQRGSMRDASVGRESGTAAATQQKKEAQIPMIYVCATMWHENRNEMVHVLKSIYSLDEDQCLRRKAKEKHLSDRDFYKFEAHIFFDDAMTPHDEASHNYSVNAFVKTMVETVAATCRNYYGIESYCRDPNKYDTPYGGRLEWSMPGGNKLIAHLKDKTKVKQRKRWSQVMYMYYFLGDKLWASESSEDIKKIKANNTFVLTLDGDVSFKPRSLALLLDLMKGRTTKVGAASGRVHPTGSGPMVWYQKFEYAFRHWLLKATEHVLGCVLCSPGCFSLFRASALMDHNVLRKYAAASAEASDVIMCDQGDDRYLSTLLIQAGWKLEYCAAADVETCAPGGFVEFYNQRRRWIPSIMANTQSLLENQLHTRRHNINISFLYIAYQALVLIFALIGPGTVFVIIISAMTVCLPIDLLGSIILNVVPLTFFIIVCYSAKAETQLEFAMILTAIYAIIQMVVAVGVIIIMVEDPLSATAMFMFIVIGIFILAAILHPQECINLIYGFIYYLGLPSTYMLLIIYAITNLHVTSWGTREIKKSKLEEQIEEAEEMQANQMIFQRKAPADDEKNEKQGSRDIKDIVSLYEALKKKDGYTFRCGDLCFYTCCPRTSSYADDPAVRETFHKIDSLDEEVVTVHESMTNLHNKVKSLNNEDTKIEIEYDTGVDNLEDKAGDSCSYERWFEDRGLGNGVYGKLNKSEEVFFGELIREYLEPSAPNTVEEERMAIDLERLKNKVSAAVLLGNAMLVITMLALQSSDLEVKWPLGEDNYVDPVGLLFLCCILVLLLIQTYGMLVHRISTFLHILATTKLGKKSTGTIEDEHEDVEAFMDHARIMVHREADGMSTITDATTEISGAPTDVVERKNTVRRIIKSIKKKQKVADMSSLQESLDANLQRMMASDDLEKIVRRQTRNKTSRRQKQQFINIIDRLRDADTDNMGVGPSEEARNDILFRARSINTSET